MGNTSSRHVYNLSSRDVQVYAYVPKEKRGWASAGLWGAPQDSLAPEQVVSAEHLDSSQKEKYLIGTVGFKTSKTLKFPTVASRVVLADGENGSISDIPKPPPPVGTDRADTTAARPAGDLVIEESNVGLRSLRLSLKDDKVHGERLLYVVNVDAVTALAPMMKPSTGAGGADSDTPTHEGTPEATQCGGTENQMVSAEASYIQSKLLSRDIDGPDEKPHRAVKPPKAGWVSSSSVFGAASCLAVGAVTGGIDNYRKQQRERREALISFLNDTLSLPLAQCQDIAAYLGTLDVNWCRLARRVVRDGAKGTMVGGAIGTAVAGGMVGLSQAANALQTANNVAAAGVVRGMGSGLGVMVTSAIVAAEVASHVRKWKKGNIHVRQAHRATSASVMRGTVNAGLCGLAIIPVGGMVVAVIGGVAFNVCDATFGWTEKLSGKMFKENEAERSWKSQEVHRKLISAARTAFGLSEEDALVERDLNRRLRRWMLALHPDKNRQQEHPHFHTITAAAAILINEARDIEEAKRAADPDPFDASGARHSEADISAYDLLPLMDVDVALEGRARSDSDTPASHMDYAVSNCQSPLAPIQEDSPSLTPLPSTSTPPTTTTRNSASESKSASSTVASDTPPPSPPNSVLIVP